jgi:chitodextrinase
MSERLDKGAVCRSGWRGIIGASRPRLLSSSYQWMILSAAAAALLAAPESVPGPATTVAFHLQGVRAELSGITSGSTVKATVGPAGTLRVRGSGAVNFATAGGVYFTRCCTNVNNANYEFTGTSIGTIFNEQSGQISFSLTSRQNWQTRKTETYRTVFTVQDVPGNNIFSFAIATVADRLSLAYRLGSTAANNHYIPAGQEDVVFGTGKTIAVRLTWDGATRRLYLNGALASTTTYTPVDATWSSASVLTIGGNNSPPAGVYNVSDDVISEFIVVGTEQAPDPIGGIAAPTNLVGQAVSSTQVNLSWTGVSRAVGYRVYRNGAQLGSTTATTFASVQLTPSTRYTFEIVAIDSANTVSPKSNQATVTTLAATPTVDSPSTIAANTWTSVTPTYVGAPDGGQIWPMSWNNMSVYDPVTKRTIVFDRWSDSVRGRSIYANALLAFNPSTNAVEVLKLNNWVVKQKADGGYTTEPMTANTTEPTPVDRHPFGGLALDTTNNHVYLVNGLNQSSAVFPQDTWKFNLGTRRWTKVADATTVHPPNDGGKFSNLVYNSAERKLVQFAVRGGIGTQTWVFDTTTEKWTLLPEDATSKGVFVSGAGMAYDSKRNRILAYGGGTSYWVTGAQLWSYSLAENKWTKLTDGPTATTAPEFAYDSKNDVFLALVGSDTLVYKPETNTWNRIPTPVAIPRGKVTNFQSLTYSPAHDVFVFQGGTFDNPLWYLFRYNAASLPALPSDNSAPAVPTGLVATALSASEIKLTWTASTDNVGVAGYQVYTLGSPRGKVTTASYTEKGLLPSMTYTFTVAAYDAIGNMSAQSVQVSGRTLASSTTPDTGSPTLSAIAAGTLKPNSATITWTTNEPSDSQVDYGPTTAYGQSTPVNTSAVTAHSVVLSGLTPATTYNYRVRSKDAAGNVATSANLTFATPSVTAVTDTQAPAVPTGLKASAVSASQINVTWTASTDNVGVTGYRVYRDNVLITTVATTSYSNTGLRAATAYAYRVAAVDAAGNASALAVAVTATTQATANTKPTGSFESLSSSGTLSGWAHDADDLTKPVKVQIHIDRNAGDPDASPIEIIASANRADVGNHYFTYTLPEIFRDGKLHTVWVWAVDLTDATGVSNVQLPGSPKSFLLNSTTAPPPPPGTVNVPLIIQESIYPGITGLTRVQDPLTVGIPLSDSASITSESQLSLTGASAAQFQILGRWPSGNAKWVLIDTLADVGAGGQNGSVSLVRGSGDYGGSDLATDNGATITVNTGTGQFTVRKAHFNVIDSAVVNGKTIVAPGTSQGLVVTGPVPGQTTCPPCTEVYSSVNDATSTAIIEENGPVKTVIKATGYHKHATGAAYMGFTVRLTFHKGKSHVKVTTALRNAEYGPSNTFNSAYKGFESYDLQITNALAGPKNFNFGAHTGPVTGALTTTDSAYLYQGSSDSLRHGHWCGFGCVPFSPDTGYVIVKNTSTLLSGTNKQYPQGWGDVTDTAGAGISVGVYQLAGVWPKSLEFNSGGADVRVGIWARQNSIPYYQTWPQYSIHDVYLNFHDKALTAPAEEFRKFQHYLLARASREHYNQTKVFPYPLIDGAEEDEYYKTIGATAAPTIAANRACCIEDFGTTNANFPLSVFRFFGWRSAGGGGMGNQSEFRWSFLLNYLSRGFTGRYLLSSHFYRYQAEHAFPRSDGFQWRDRPNTELDAFGFPERIVSANSTLAHRNWMDQEHAHWYGMMDFYFMSGDRTILDGILDGAKDRYLNPKTSANNPLMNASSGLYNTRAVGAQLMATGRMYEFLKAIGDPDADAALAQGTKTFDMQVKPELCVSGYPVGCNPGVLDSLNGAGIDSGTRGVSRTRGMHWGPAGRSGTFCLEKHQYRVNSVLQNSILLQGMWEFLKVKGPMWADYETAQDLALGMSEWALTETYQDDGSENWAVNGYRFGIGIDVPNTCDANWQPYVGATVWFPMYVQHELKGVTDWDRRFRTVLRKNMGSLGIGSTDFGTFQTFSLIDKLKRSTAPMLTNIPITVRNLGGGSYELSWTVPAGAQSYRIKWGDKKIVDWIGFDAGANNWIGDPVTTMAWFAATNVSNEPVPATAGTIQKFTLTGLPTTLAAPNFSVKAYVR